MRKRGLVWVVIPTVVILIIMVVVYIKLPMNVSSINNKNEALNINNKNEVLTIINEDKVSTINDQDTVSNKNKVPTMNNKNKVYKEMSEEDLIAFSINDVRALTQELYSQYYFGDISINESNIKVISRNEEDKIYVIQSMSYIQDEFYIGKDEITFRVVPNGKIRFISIDHVESMTLPKEMVKLQSSDMPIVKMDLNNGANHIEKIIYENFSWWNENESFENFQVSEKYWNGELHYCYSDLDKDIIVYVSSDYTMSTVICPNGTFSFDSSVVGYFGSANGRFYLKDVTGDGIDEFIYLYGYGGTGVWESHVRVFNLQTFEEYEVEDFTQKMERSIKVEVESFEPETKKLRSDELQSGIATCKITDMYGNVGYGTVFAYAKEGSLPEYIPDDQSDYYMLDWNDELNRLEASTGITLKHSFGQYLGGVSGYFIYDEAEQCFKSADDFTYKMYETISDK